MTAAALLIAAAITLLTLMLAALIRLGVAFSPASLSPFVPKLWLALHLVCVVPAVALGGYVLLRRKGDARHRMLGRVWAVLMIGAALSSFALKGLFNGSVSPIHLLSILVLVRLPFAIRNARRGRIAQHRRTMIVLYVSLLVAGIFSFFPGRLMWLWLVA